MKRSEMLAIMESKINLGRELSDSSTTIASELLDVMEKLGMFYCTTEKLDNVGNMIMPKGYDEE